MAGWSILLNGSGLDCREILRTFHSKSHFEIDNSAKGGVDGCGDNKDELRGLFNRVLLVFLKEAAGKNCTRPVPPLLGDGRCADLFELFWVVRERGGFDSVSQKGLWSVVAEELGLEFGIASCVKLIYVKYLIELDQWFNNLLRDKSLGSLQSECGGNAGYSSLVELEAESRGSLFATENVDIMHKDAEKSCRICDDDDEKIISNHDDHYNDVVMLDVDVHKKEFSPCKRKRDSLIGMLNWVFEVAKHPADFAVGVIADGAQGKECTSEEFRAQALWAREMLLLPRHVDSCNDQSASQKKLRMHPSMYEDTSISNYQSTERLRCSKRLPSLSKSNFCPCCNPSPATQTKLAGPIKSDSENLHKEKTVVAADLSDPNMTAVSDPNMEAGSVADDTREKHVSVGPLFQAEVPEWTGVVLDSDPKWLGTRIWPVENGELGFHVGLEAIGKGRQDCSGCRLPGSVECVRFHIAEKRMKLKLELGLVFYHWRFNHMGEEVSLGWTLAEEKRFKDMVRFNPPSQGKCFWDHAFKYFPRKKRKNLVSYYFNAHLVQRRSYQNRVTPKNIDSDDDESDFGSFSVSFGHEAVKVPGSEFLICTQNEQCTELE